MSAPETSPSSVPGKRDDQPTREEPTDPNLPTDLSQTQNDTSDTQPRNSMSAEEATGSQAQSDSVSTVPESTMPAQRPASTPSQPDSLAGHMENLSVSGKHVPDSPPASSASHPPPPPPEKDESYTNLTSTGPGPALQAASEANSAPSSEKELPEVPGDSDPESKPGGQGDEVRDDQDSQPEIQNIMGQFQDPARTTDQQVIMSPRMELAGQFRGAQNYFPARRSSLGHSQQSMPGPSAGAQPATRASPVSQYHHRKDTGHEEPTLTRRSSSSTVPPPPEPEPDQPFDFHRFLEQLRHRTADPVAKFLRSFLMEFGKRQWMVHEQVKIISDFLAFITNKMAMCEVWRDVSDSEFDNAKEGMEKLVMNRLYSQTFAPAIPAPPTIPRSASRSRRREIERLHGPWRRGQHQEDIERDDILTQKIRIYSWVSEEHLDIPPVSGGGRRFLSLAQQGMSPAWCSPWRALIRYRTVKDQRLPSASRQSYLHFELLQSHLWSFEKHKEG